ncbi:MAG: hypothetical protein J6S14_00970 [Clostridia bacterium]|nr:hypothetical protein [Clostridia bacterium]
MSVAGNAWFSGAATRAILGKHRPLWVWNVIFSLAIAGAVFYCAGVLNMILCENIHSTYDATYEACENEILYTDQGTFELSSSSSHAVPLESFLDKVDHGDSIELCISDISGKVLKIHANGELVYQPELASVGVMVFLSILSVTILGVFIFALVIANIKHPKGKRIKKLQKEVRSHFS